MSGGSFNYVSLADEYDLWEKSSDLQAMADFLSSLPGAEDAAAETEDLIRIMRQARVRVGVIVKRMRPVWQSAEWWQSGDYIEDQFREALAEYRGEAPSAP